MVEDPGICRHCDTGRGLRLVRAGLVSVLWMSLFASCGTVANTSRRMGNSVVRLWPFAGNENPKNSAEKAAPGRSSNPAKDSVSIGEIIYVQREQGFALIKSTYAGRLATGTEIRGHLATGEEASTLRCSPERKPGFIVADIVSGDPQAGHVAFVAQVAVQTTEAGAVVVPGAATSGRSTRVIPGLAPSGSGTAGGDDLPPLPDFPSVPVEELPDFPID